MRFRFLLLACLLITACRVGPGPGSDAASEEAATRSAAAADPSAQEREIDPTISPELRDRVSYYMGRNWGRHFRREEFDANMELLNRGISDYLADEPPLYSDAELDEAWQLFRGKLRVRRQQRQEALAARNAEAGAAFLAELRGREGVVAQRSGLMYEILRRGDGPRPAADDVVKVHYRGTLIDGSAFDDTFATGTPLTISLQRVVAGWQEALPLMGVGSRWKLYVPPELAYGERGFGDRVGPQATLIFEIELLGIEGRP